jgi:transposase
MENEIPRKGKEFGVGRKLNKEQEKIIFDLITTRRPFQLGFKLPYKNAKLYLWTRELLWQFIKEKFEVNLTDGGVVNYLKRWGFSPLNRFESKQKQCHTAIQKWLALNLESVIIRSKNENALIYWMGEIDLIGFNAIERGRNKRLTMVPVIENQGRVHWLTLKREFDDERQVKFLNSLANQNRAKIFLIRKTVTHFKTKLVIDWLSQNQNSIEIFPPPEWITE